MEDWLSEGQSKGIQLFQENGYGGIRWNNDLFGLKLFGANLGYFQLLGRDHFPHHHTVASGKTCPNYCLTSDYLLNFPWDVTTEYDFDLSHGPTLDPYPCNSLSFRVSTSMGSLVCRNLTGLQVHCEPYPSYSPLILPYTRVCSPSSSGTFSVSSFSQPLSPINMTSIFLLMKIWSTLVPSRVQAFL